MLSHTRACCYFYPRPLAPSSRSQEPLQLLVSPVPFPPWRRSAPAVACRRAMYPVPERWVLVELLVGALHGKDPTHRRVCSTVATGTLFFSSPFFFTCALCVSWPGRSCILSQLQPRTCPFPPLSIDPVRPAEGGRRDERFERGGGLQKREAVKKGVGVVGRRGACRSTPEAQVTKQSCFSTRRVACKLDVPTC